jgi:hypothetical protein
VSELLEVALSFDCEMERVGCFVEASFGSMEAAREVEEENARTSVKSARRRSVREAD